MFCVVSLTAPRKGTDGDYLVATCDGEELMLLSNVSLPQDDKPGCVSVFFLVQTTPKEEDANMEIFQVKEGDAKVPLLRNFKILQQHDKLLRFVPKKASAPTALSFSPAKRQRTKGR